MSVTWDFAGKTALVTGGAGGIGEAIVRKLAAASAEVLFSDLKEADGRALEHELREAGANVRFCVSDACDEDQVKALIALALSLSGRLDIAINNVGGMAKGAGDNGRRRIHDSDLTAWQATVDLNLTSCFLGMKHQLVPMLAAGGGAIVNLTSLAGMRWSDAASPAYSAAKAGVIRLTQYAAAAYASAGIRVNVVAPGFTATETLLKAFPDEAERSKRAATLPMGRMMQPSELADACLWACSDAASGVTGLTIPVDGGKMAT
jgi:NAD(P)-dependent dehydrogenase (short-subunit alcohol dehydrogenase family)